jgi:hypothetical protein
MKLADQYADGSAYYGERNSRAPQFVLAHLSTLSLREIAYFERWDNEQRLFYIATEVGLVVATFTPSPNVHHDPSLQTEVVPWQRVGRIDISIQETMGDGPSLTVRLLEPLFEHVATRERDRTALVEFAIACVERQGATQMRAVVRSDDAG